MAWSGPAGSNAKHSLEPFAGAIDTNVAAAPIKIALATPHDMPAQSVIEKKPAAAVPPEPVSTTLTSTTALTAPIGIPPQHDIDESLQVEVVTAVPLPPIKRPVVERSHDEICDTLAYAAQTNDLPVPFFIRLLFQESGFQAHVVSHAGAEGIAQFMPATAAGMGLENPFDPLQAIPASARLLRELIGQFGNLGLAAAAYNAGPKRIQDWLAKKGKLPEETQGYVKIITGKPAETWTVASAGGAEMKLPRRAPCQQTAALHAWDGPEEIPLPPTRTPVTDVKVASVSTAPAAASNKPPQAALRTADAKSANNGKQAAPATDKAKKADTAARPSVTTTPDKRKQMIIRVADLKIANKEPERPAAKAAANTKNAAKDAAAPAKPAAAAKPAANSAAKPDPSLQLAARQRKEAKVAQK
ncbi:MAG: lytic transglycosylase domain-containing protein [Pseudolabrys sp.]|nr:lytic transglycosylase domain-containing protein [Pseudolabrys sp.]